MLEIMLHLCCLKDFGRFHVICNFSPFIHQSNGQYNCNLYFRPQRSNIPHFSFTVSIIPSKTSLAVSTSTFFERQGKCVLTRCVHINMYIISLLISASCISKKKSLWFICNSVFFLGCSFK